LGLKTVKEAILHFSKPIFWISLIIYMWTGGNQRILITNPQEWNSNPKVLILEDPYQVHYEERKYIPNYT
jgi:hypothetical protein